MRPMEIAARRERIRLPKKELAERAGVHEMTVNRALRDGANPLHDTLKALERVIVEDELALRDHLLELHGAPERSAAA